jgi:hypothetical protein
MEEQTGIRARFERPVGGTTEREKGRERRVRPRECYAARGVSWGLALTGGRRPAAARAQRARATCTTRALPAGNREGWGLTGGPRHSVGRRCR